MSTEQVPSPFLGMQQLHHGALVKSVISTQFNFSQNSHSRNLSLASLETPKTMQPAIIACEEGGKRFCGMRFKNMRELM